MKTALELIAAERQRQITEKGYTPEHDDDHIGGEIASGAACYANVAGVQCSGVDDSFVVEYAVGLGRQDWPFPVESFHVSDDPLRNLVKAGAMITAEIERLQRARAKGINHVSH